MGAPTASSSSSSKGGARRLDRSLLVAALGSAVVVAWTFGPSLGLYFDPIDDPGLVQAVSTGREPTPQFRPLFAPWNRLLFEVFGAEPLGWRIAGLALHLASAVLLAWLARRLGVGRVAAAGAGWLFAAFDSGHEAVLWIAANCGLLSVFFALVAACAWAAYLQRPRAWMLCWTLLAVAASMGSKQDCVLLAPLLIGIDVRLRGARALWTRASSLRYALLAALGLAWLALAYRPELWARDATVGRYGFGAGTLLDAVGNLGLLFAIGRIEATARSWPALVAGAAVLLGLATFARCSPRNRGLALTGLCVAVVAILPVLPGGVRVAGTRYAYPAAIGIALCFAAVLDELWTRAGSLRNARVGRGLLIACALGWVGVQASAIRAIIAWRYEPRSACLENLMETTRGLVRTVAPLERAWILAPPIWSLRDFVYGVEALVGPQVRVANVEWLAWAEELEPALAKGGRLDRETHAIFAAGTSGRLARLGLDAPVPLELLLDNVREYAPSSPAARIPVVELELRR